MIINSLRNNYISFKSLKTDKKPSSFAEIPELDERYTTPEQQAKTVTILGASRTTEQIADALGKAFQTGGELVKRGYNVITGCGNAGIMGAAYQSAHEAEISIPKNGVKPGENLAIVVNPPWGDENLKDCRAIGITNSEAERITKFEKTSDNFLVFPGSAASIQEATTLISDKLYQKTDKPKNIILIGKKFFAGLKQQYDELYKAGQLKDKKLEELFKVVDSSDEILKNFPVLKQN